MLKYQLNNIWIDSNHMEVVIMQKVKISKGKFEGMNAVADKNGVIAALAIDQRGSLQKAIVKAKGSATAEDLSMFKVQVSELLTPYACLTRNMALKRSGTGLRTLACFWPTRRPAMMPPSRGDFPTCCRNGR
jgi:hypothetical protein